MSGWVSFCLGMYLGGVVVGMALCLTMLGDYVFGARWRPILCVVFWPIALSAAAFCAAAFTIGKMANGRDAV